MRLERAQALADLGRTGDAEAEVRRVLAAEPADAEALMMLAHLQLVDRRYADTLRTADAAVVVRPYAERAHRLRAMALSGMGRHREAVEAAGRAVELDPFSSIVLRCSATVLHAAGQSAPALDAAHRAIRLDPLDPEAHFRLADIASDTGDRALARRAYEETLRLRPEHVAARHDLAVLDFRRRRVRRALVGLLDAAAAAPQGSVAGRNIVGVLAWCVGLVGAVDVLAALACTQLLDAGGLASRLVVATVGVLVLMAVSVFIARLPRQLLRAIPLLARQDRSLAGAAGLTVAGHCLIISYPITGAVPALQIGALAVCASMVWFRLSLVFPRRRS